MKLVKVRDKRSSIVRLKRDFASYEDLSDGTRVEMDKNEVVWLCKTEEFMGKVNGWMAIGQRLATESEIAEEAARCAAARARKRHNRWYRRLWRRIARNRARPALPEARVVSE